MKAGDEMKVVLIFCTSSKDVVYVLSAKHGLLCEN